MSASNVIYRPPTLNLGDFTFSDFVDVFLLGNARSLLTSSPAFGAFDGNDPVKTTMLLQVLRRFPIITAIPLTVTVVLAIATILKVLITVLSPLHDQGHHGHPGHHGNRGVYQGKGDRRYLLDNAWEEKYGARTRRSSDEYFELSEWFQRLIVFVCSTLDDLQFTYEEGEEGEDDEKIRLKRDTRQKGVTRMMTLGFLLEKLILALVEILPDFGTCLGAFIGCHVRYNFWQQTCMQFGPVISCTTLIGSTIRAVIDSVEEEHDLREEELLFF